MVAAPCQEFICNVFWSQLLRHILSHEFYRLYIRFEHCHPSSCGTHTTAIYAGMVLRLRHLLAEQPEYFRDCEGPAGVATINNAAPAQS